ncbi:hypothetical protein J2X31_002177 [Flavobacterium arsenatis]|uniref:T4 RNA ligase 1-like N-terminal domain-containing protein n=1 Tax=Flavobacterium arsenatis TaxID=1484332 RepID=A0ABU1TQC4_9FLAO|nr:immunity 26/phosphotriesterase HocA family protein [Flavobacterium arsenatis]MDR6968162.1 hypothetical protein [Flavobacterium arsenatis]
MTTAFELTNDQRKYFGLDPIEKNWERFVLKGDKYRADSFLYFDGDVIKRHITTTEDSYIERHYNEATRSREILLPKTDKGKDKKLSGSTLEQRQGDGVYLEIYDGHLRIGNFTSQTTFYSSRWDNEDKLEQLIPNIITDFINNSTQNHLNEIEIFKKSKRKNIKFKAGDYFCFKINRTEFGFGRILLDIGSKMRKLNLVKENHKIFSFMGQPVFVELFVFKSITKNIDIEVLQNCKKLPSDAMMDNVLLYGDYEIIGHKEIRDEEYDFPISFVCNSYHNTASLQWGLIQIEQTFMEYEKLASKKLKENIENNHFRYATIGYSPKYGSIEILKTLKKNDIYDFEDSKNYTARLDLRNPKFKEARNELLKIFGLNPSKNYYENSILTNTILPSEINKKMK